MKPTGCISPNKEENSMDIMDKVNDLVESITKNDDLMAQFKKDPVKVIKTLLNNIDLDDAIMDQLVTAVKSKINLDKAGALLGGLKKLF